MKPIVTLALVASAPVLLAQAPASQGRATTTAAATAAAATPSVTPSAAAPLAIVFSEKGANGMSDLPMGVHRIPDSNVVVSGHQGGGGIGMLFGVVGMLVQSSMNAEAGTGKIRDVSNDLRFDIRAKAIELTDAAVAADRFRTAFTLKSQPGGSTMTVTPYVVLTFVKKTDDVRPYVVLKTKVTTGGDTGKAIKYFCCEGSPMPLASLTENGGARLKEVLTGELATAVDVMLLDRSQPIPRNDDAKVTAEGLVPFVGKPMKWRGFDMGRFKDYQLIEFRGGSLVFGGVNIVEPGGLEISPAVKK